jgi:DNA gyrase/topoisomerase IV subunit B
MEIKELKGLVKCLFAAISDARQASIDLTWKQAQGQVEISTQYYNVIYTGSGNTEVSALRRLTAKLLNESIRRTNRLIRVATSARKRLGPSVSGTLASEFRQMSTNFKKALGSEKKPRRP